MHCACVYVDCDSYETINVIKKDMRIAGERIVHKCSECKETIPVGAKFEHTRYKSEEQFYTHKICSVCMNLREIFFCDGWTLETLLQDLGQHIQDLRGDLPSECILSLEPQARNIVFEMIEESWESFYD